MDGIIYFLFAVLVLIGIFFLCRELFCWYWKINDIKDLLTQIVSKLDNLNLSDDTTSKLVNLKEPKTSENNETNKTSEKNNETNTSSQLPSEINNFDDLLQDPKIKEEAYTIRKFYGEAAYNHYLERKFKELKNN